MALFLSYQCYTFYIYQTRFVSFCYMALLPDAKILKYIPQHLIIRNLPTYDFR